MLEKVVRAWKEFYLSKHSMNAIEIRVINAEAYRKKSLPSAEANGPAAYTG